MATAREGGGVSDVGRGPRSRSDGEGVHGFTLLELVIALVLAFLVARGAWSVLATQRAASVEASAVARRLDAGRVVAGVLHRELRAGVPGTDWTAPESDTLGLRAFRGLGLVCPGGTEGTGTVLVRFRGWRLPNPAKDSVLVLDASGHWSASELVDGGSSSAAECLPGFADARGLWLRISTVPEGPVLLRFFERGSYHLTDGALRYRVGRGGRQPLTDEIFGGDGSRLRSEPSGISVELEFDDPGSRASGTESIRIWSLERG